MSKVLVLHVLILFKSKMVTAFILAYSLTPGIYFKIISCIYLSWYYIASFKNLSLVIKHYDGISVFTVRLLARRSFGNISVSCFCLICYGLIELCSSQYICSHFCAACFCSLRVMTINALRSSKRERVKSVEYTEDDVTVDPLIVLRCDKRVFRWVVLTTLRLWNLIMHINIYTNIFHQLIQCIFLTVDR